MKNLTEKAEQEAKDKRDGLRPPTHFTLHDFDRGQEEGLVDRENGRVVQSNTPEMQATLEFANWVDPTGRVTRRRVEGAFILSFYKDELMWGISLVSGAPTPAFLSGRYTTPQECSKGIIAYQAQQRAAQQPKKESK